MRRFRSVPALLFALLVSSPLEAIKEKPPTATPSPLKVQCLDDARVLAGKADEKIWFCLYSAENGRLRLAVVVDDDVALANTSVTISAALAMLANPKVAPLHRPILDTAGPGLEKLRLDALEDLKQREYKSEYSQNSLIELNPGAIGRLIDKSQVLISLGQKAAAIAAIEKVLAEFEKKVKARKGKRLSTDLQWRWFSLRMTYNGFLIATGDIDKGLASYRQLAADERILARYRTNAKVNIAAFLAEMGKFEEALVLIDQAMAEFEASEETAVHYKLGGSNRHFAWIRACSLNGLGRVKEAMPLIDLVLASPEKPAEYYADIYSTSSIERRLYSCMGDVDRMVDWFKKRAGNPLYGHSASLYLQPGLKMPTPWQQVFLEKLRAHPEAQKLLEEVNILSPSVLPALNRWQ